MSKRSIFFPVTEAEFPMPPVTSHADYLEEQAIVNKECHACKYQDKMPCEDPCVVCVNNYVSQFRAKK